MAEAEANGNGNRNGNGNANGNAAAKAKAKAAANENKRIRNFVVSNMTQLLAEIKAAEAAKAEAEASAAANPNANAAAKAKAAANAVANEAERRRVNNILYTNNTDEMDKYLYEKGKNGEKASAEFLINEGDTPLCIARSVKMANYLLENGANISFRDEKRARTPLLWQANSGYDESPKIIQFLLSVKPEIIHDVDINGENALHLCVFRGYETSLECAKILLAANPPIDVNATRNDGRTALDIASASNNSHAQKIVEFLLEKRAKTGKEMKEMKASTGQRKNRKSKSRKSKSRRNKSRKSKTRRS